MSDIPPIDSRLSYTPPKPVRQAEAPLLGEAAGSPDSVEISDTGRLLATLENPVQIRAEKVASIREQIRNGTYETPEKIDATVDRLLGILTFD